MIRFETPCVVMFTKDAIDRQGQHIELYYKHRTSIEAMADDMDAVLKEIVLIVDKLDKPSFFGVINVELRLLDRIKYQKLQQAIKDGVDNETLNKMIEDFEADYTVASKLSYQRRVEISFIEEGETV